MVTYTYLMKNLDDAQWTDVTSAVIDDKPSLRMGYSSLDSTLDMGSLTVQMRMADLTNAALLHTTKKQLQLKEDGFIVFEGISADDASVDLGKTTDLVYAKLKFKAYSSLFADAKASAEIVWHNLKVNDPGDAPNSLLHKLFGEIKATSPLLSSLSILSGGAVNQKIIPLVIIEEGESLEGVLTEFLRQNGLAYYMNVNIVNVVRPYDVGRIPSQTIAIEDIIEKPSIQQAPYVEEEPIVVKFGKIVSKANEQVYELNANRNDDGSMLEHDEIPVGEYYPVDSDDEPSILQADYQTRFETDDIKLIYSTDQVMTITAKKGLSGTIVDATLTKVKADLKATGADIQLRNDEGELVSLYNLVIKANAYYRDFSERYGDKNGKEIDGIYLADADSAKDLWRVIRAEQKAEKTKVRFTSHIEIEPNTLISLTGLPYSLLVRYRTRKLDAWRLFEYECVAYQLTADLPQGAIKIASDTRPQDGVSYRTKVQFALGTAEAPLGDWQETPPTPAAGEYVWRREGTYLPPSEPTDWTVTRLTGDKGETGDIGQGIDSITEEYAISTSKTTAPSSGWSGTAPTWSTGKYLWTRSKIVYKNPADTKYTTPFCDTSWEAAIEVGKDVEKYVQSRGENLVTNGSGLLGNNKNFSHFTYDGSEAYYSSGSFKYVGAGTKFTDEFMPVNPEIAYKLSMFAKTAGGTGRYYAMVGCFDVDNRDISASHHMYRANTLTTLAQELKNGDTVVYLADASNWYNDGTAGVNTHLRSIIIWNYKNSYGYQYPPLTYSRNWTGNAWNPGAINFSNNTITLRVPWSGGTVEAGTQLSNGSSGGTYKYLAMSNTNVPTTWTEYTGIMDGIDLSGTNSGGKFPPGTAKTKIGWLLNYQGSGETIWIANVSFSIHVAKQSDLDSTNKIVDKSIKSSDVEYYLSTSSTSLSGGAWQTTAPDWVDGKFMWTRTKTTLNDGTVLYSPSEGGTCIAGAKGATGDPAPNLKAQYSVNGTSSWHNTFATGDKYMRTSNDNGATYSTAMKIVGEDGSDGLDGEDGSYTIFEFSKGTATTAGTTWQDSPFIIGTDEYNWMRKGTVVPPATTVSSWSTPVRVTGDKGETGDIGQGIESITEQYAISTSKTTPPAEGSTDWKDVAPTWSTGKYLWTRSKIVYKNPADTKYTTPFCDTSWEAVNEVKDELNTIENHYGYKYFTDITVYGDSDKLYPVIIKGGNQGTKRDIFVRRGYSELAPPDWNTSTHKGDLVVKIKCNFGGWGGANYSWEIHELEEMYSRTFAGCQNVMSNMAFAIFLRGGGTTGARYHLYSNQSLTTPKYGGASPQICYNNELLGETGQYSWNAPDPKTFKTLKPDRLQDSDQQAIDVRNFIPLSKKSVKTSDVEYYLSTSSTALSGGSWQTTAPQWVDGKFMWTRTKTTLNDGTVSYSPSSGGTCIAGAKGATGPKGEDYRSIEIASIGDTLYYTSRGTLKTPSIDIFIKTNVEGIPIITASEGAIAEDEGQYIFVASGVSYSENPVIITAELGDYQASLTINKIRDGKPVPENFKGISDVGDIPTTFGADPLINGDYFLWVSEDTEYPLAPDGVVKTGEVYEYRNGTWLVSTNQQLYMNLLPEFIDVANSSDSEVIGNAIIKKLATIEAFIHELTTNELTLSQNGSIASSYDDNGEMKRYQKGMIDDNTLPEDFGGFLLEADGYMELVRVRARDGEYSGVLESADTEGTLLHTQKYELGRQLPVSPKTYYLASEILPHFPDKASKEVSINEGSYVHAFKPSKIKSGTSIGFDVRTLDNSRTVALPEIKGSSRVVLYNSTPYISKVEYSKNGGAFTAMSGSAGVSVSQGDDIRIRQTYNNPNAFVSLGQTSRYWRGMTTLGNNVYACVSYGDIYKQTNGTGNFVALGQESRRWSAMTTLGNDVYASVYEGDIYKQTNGTGDFVALGQASRRWRGMTTLGNDVYACVYNGDIYKQSNATGDFIALGQTSRNWWGMTTLGNDVYAYVNGGDIYKQTNATGDFIALGQASRLWRGMTTLGNDVYACVYNGDIYKQSNATGDFIALGQTSRNWWGMTTLGNDVYACVGSGDIYKQSYNPAHQSTISIALPNTEALVLACTNTPTANGTYDDFNGEVITFDTANDQSEKSVVIKNGGTTLFDSALNLCRTFKSVYDELEGIGTYALDDTQSTVNGTQAGYVVKSQNQLTFLTLAKAVITTIGSTTYTKIDAILYLLGQTRGVKTATLLPETGASIGTAQNPYSEGHFNYLDIKGNQPLLTKSLNGYPGMVHSDGTDSDYLRTPLNGLIPYASGGSGYLGTSYWPFNYGHFKNLDVAGPIVCTTINTGQGATEVHLMNQNLRTTDNVTFNQVTTQLGPNKPVDNNDASMPSVNIGGFSYAVHTTSQKGAYPSITIGSGGTWVYVAVSSRTSSSTTRSAKVGRVSGGSSVQGTLAAPTGGSASVYVIAWRIA